MPRETGLFVAEQNAGSGLANRVASRWATRVFTSFPHTEGLARGEWVGNPVRRALTSLDRDTARPQALAHYGLDARYPVLGAVGGSLGAGVINAAVSDLVGNWERKPDPGLASHRRRQRQSRGESSQGGPSGAKALRGANGVVLRRQ